MFVTSRVDQLRCDAHAIARPYHRSFHNGVDIQLLGNPPQRFVDPLSCMTESAKPLAVPGCEPAR